MRINSIKSVVALVGLSALMAITATAYAAASVATGRVAQIVLGTSASAFNYVTIAGTGTNFTSPPCGLSGRGSFVLSSLSTDAGKATLSLLNAALLSGKTVSIIGTGTCMTVPNQPASYELLSVVFLNQ